MRRFLILFVLLPLAIVAVVAVGRQPSRRRALARPASVAPRRRWSLDVPLFVLLFATLALGVLIGGVATWIGQGKWRQRGARRARQCGRPAPGCRAPARAGRRDSGSRAAIRRPRRGLGRVSCASSARPRSTPSSTIRHWSTRCATPSAPASSRRSATITPIERAGETPRCCSCRPGSRRQRRLCRRQDRLRLSAAMPARGKPSVMGTYLLLCRRHRRAARRPRRHGADPVAHGRRLGARRPSSRPARCRAAWS